MRLGGYFMNSPTDMDSEDAISAKRRKTENNDENNEVEDHPMAEEAEITEDTDTFLQDFLSKRPQNNLTIFQRVIQEEETEAKERDPSDDLKLYRDACADFSDYVSDIAEIKATKPEGWKESVNELRKEAAFITLIMKKLNRVEKTRTKMTREKISKEKQKVDVARVKLDNMLSEIHHLRKEIDKCLKFRSRPLGIDLVPVNEFYDKAPPSISKPDVTKSDEHQLQLARLEWELKQRKELSSLLSELEDKRSAVREQIDKKEKDLISLGPLVNEVLMVSQPLKEKLGSSSIKESSIADHAYYLPDPLYFLFVQATAYREVSDKDISLEIKGSFVEAQKLRDRNLAMLEENEKIEASKEMSQKKVLAEEKNKLLSKHPLFVHMKFSLKDGFLFDFQFTYYMNLNIVTVKPTITTPSGFKTPSSADVLLNPKNFLHNIFPGDSGSESPNLLNYYQMQKVGLDSLPLDKMGPPYIWAQKIVGLNFVAQSQKVSPKQDVCRTNLPVVIKELKRRCLHRISLLSLCENLEQGEVMPPSNMKHLKLSSQLNSITGISWSEYSEDPLGERFKDSPLVTPNDLYFKALISRGEAKLSCLIVLKPDYPLSPCTLSLMINYEPFESDDLRKKYSLDIEEEVNVYWKELLTSRTQANYILSYQIFKAMLCFDIALENLFPEKFPSDRQHQSSIGETKSFPFKYLPEENKFVHRVQETEENDVPME